MSTEPVFILKEVKVVCFDTLLQVLILEELEGRGWRLEVGWKRCRDHVQRVCKGVMKQGGND
jgi:hypothetical protein